MTIYEVLQSAHINLTENGQIGLLIGREQLNNAMKQLEEGKDLHDEFDDEED